MSDHFADRMIEYFALNANSVSIDPIMYFLRASVRLNPILETMVVTRLNHLATIAPGPLEMTAKTLWTKLIQKLPFQTRTTKIGKLYDAFFNLLGEQELLDYAPTPPGKSYNNSKPFLKINHSHFARCAKK